MQKSPGLIIVWSPGNLASLIGPETAESSPSRWLSRVRAGC